MSTEKAARIRRKLMAMLDNCQIYPRKNADLDEVSLALFARMAELHGSICVLVAKGKRRDAVILGRTLCEAVISHYWLTNRDTDTRIDRYIKFGGQVRLESMARVKEIFGYIHVPSDKTEIMLLKQAEALFPKGSYKWNNVGIGDMAREPDEYEARADGTSANLSPQHRLFYFWFSLLSHPCIHALECFLPLSGKPFGSAKPSYSYRTIPELYVVFLSTCWLLQIAVRINQVLKLRLDTKLSGIFDEIRRKKALSGAPLAASPQKGSAGSRPKAR